MRLRETWTIFAGNAVCRTLVQEKIRAACAGGMGDQLIFMTAFAVCLPAVILLAANCSLDDVAMVGDADGPSFIRCPYLLRFRSYAFFSLGLNAKEMNRHLVKFF